jgi:hypothetical protein
MKKLFNYFHYISKHLFCLFLFLGSMTGLAAQKVSGTIKDTGTSEPIIGAAVSLKGTSKGTVSDVNGNFSLELGEKEKNATLVISFVGYETQEIAINGQETLNIALKAGKNLEEVVVTGVLTRGRVWTLLRLSVI